MKTIKPAMQNLSKKFLSEEANEPEHKGSLGKGKKFKKPMLKFGGK